MKQTLLMLLCCIAVGLMPCHADDKPTADTYSFPMKPGDETWKVYEIRSTDQEIQIYTGEWKPGMYIVTAKADSEVMTKKILIK